ncbi:MAG: molybdate ABC transporter substrate-binding protein [Alphaproteobacteria bacterium]
MIQKLPLWALTVGLVASLAMPLVMSVAGAQTRATSAGPQGKSLLVFAATSLAGALAPEMHLFQAQSGIKVRVAYASSSLLARQIAFGAQADLYISAHQRWLDYLAARDLLDRAPPATLFSNALVLATARPGMKPVALTPGVNIAPLLGAGLLAMGDPDHVPVGIYGKSALQWLGAWPALRRKIARADNARAALVMVERGEVALGLVYLTDARQAGLTIVADFPEISHAPIVYSAAIIAKSRNRQAASAFVAFLKSPATTARFAALGYLPVLGDSGK